jgi:hypothetical protein
MVVPVWNKVCNRCGYGMTCDIRADADNSSNRTGDGGIHPSGPLLGDAIQHTPNSNIIEFPSGRAFLPDSRAKEREPFIDLRELATGFFLGCIVALAAVLICIGFIGYRAFVS